MIDFQALLFTLALLLCIVALTTIAAIANKIHSNREDASKREFLDRLGDEGLVPASRSRA